MVVMYNGRETGGDRVTMQRLRRVNVMYMDSISHMINNREAAGLIRKIRQSVVSWWYGYWTHVIKYKDSMIVKLMESFDTDAAKLAEYSSFDVETLTVEVDIPDDDGRLDQLELDLGLNSWAADSEEIDGIRMSITGHKAAVRATEGVRAYP